MSQDVRQRQDTVSVKEGIAGGISVGAAVLLGTVGIIQLLQGIAAVAEDELFVSGQMYLFKLDLTSWGWIHIGLGAIMVVVGIALVTGATWARVSAVVIASLSILANFMWLPYYPWWSMLIIAFDVVVIWAVSTWNTRTVY